MLLKRAQNSARVHVPYDKDFEFIINQVENDNSSFQITSISITSCYELAEEMYTFVFKDTGHTSVHFIEFESLSHYLSAKFNPESG